MHTLWITQCTIQRVSLHEGLVLDLDDYNELVIATAMELTLPPVGPYPEEQVVIDPDNMAPQHRALLDMAGATCTHAECDDNGALHLALSTGHRIDVTPDGDRASWELYGKRHGYMACLPPGQVRIVRHDLPIGDIGAAAS